jgi:hypothetical protein
MHLRKSLIAVATVITLTLLPVTAANAAEPAGSSSPETTTTFMPMVVKGYDSSVAAANGYKIVTNTDGAQSSVPVTAAAKAQDQLAKQMRADALSGGSAMTAAANGGDKWGDCGGSGISAVKQANDQLAWHTWFTVFGAASGYSWNVSAIGAITTNSWHMSGNGPASGSKSFDGGGRVVGPGYATVPIWSVVTLVNGAVCYSLGPIAWFG